MAPVTGAGNAEYDVVICGAGIAGLTLARQLSRELPDLSLLLIEGPGDKSSTGAIQVGESTIELSANYLANVVGLRDYLEARHYHKWGFRYFFGTAPFHLRPEIGTTHDSPITSYQLDRALLETDLKRMNAEAGIRMLQQSKVEKIVLAEGNQNHEITVRDTSTHQQHVMSSRWVIDAMGRRRFLQKQLGIATPKNSLHSAAWFRLKGRIDLCDLVPRSETAWHARVPDNNRYYSTNHLMDNGRWVWLIPLASDHTSIGIVAREDFHPFAGYNTFERASNWLHEQEPQLWERIRDMQPVDFQCLRRYTYSAKQVYSSQRWACTGDAAVFSDPFFSPGIDQVGFGNTLITEMIKRDSRLDTQTVERFNEAFLSFNNTTTSITQAGYPFYGDALVAGIKIVWDIILGFSLNASSRSNAIYLDEEKTQAVQPILSRLFPLARRVQRLFADWAVRTNKKHVFSFVDYLHLPGVLNMYQRNHQTNKSRAELVADHQRILLYTEEVAQIIFLMALADTMPERLAQMPSPLWLNAWGIGLNPERWKVDRLFAPLSAPRPLKLAEFASAFGMPELPTLIQRRSTR